MRTALIGIILVSGFLIFNHRVLAADTLAPVTVPSYIGTLGQNSWYRSGIDVTLNATDDSIGLSQTAYHIDSGSSVVTDYTTQPILPFDNNSFETTKASQIEHWYGGQGGLVLYYQSKTNGYVGNRSAAIAFLDFSGSQFYYWHNEPYSVFVPNGQAFEVSAWVKMIVFANDTSYFEVWAQDSQGNNDTLIATSNLIQNYSVSWRNATARTTVPNGLNYVYVKLGAKASPAALVYWDFVEIRSVGTLQRTVSFSYSTEGNHTLYYNSKDLANNIEAQKSSPLKIDTVVANPWQVFIANQVGCSHCYDTSVQIRDETSGLDVSTVEYRFYTEHSDQFWSGWFPLNSVKKVGNNQNALDGETEFVNLIPPNLNFGDSAHHPFRVQYRLYDMAGNLSTSPAYEITSPWTAAQGGSIYVAGEFYLPPPLNGEPNVTVDTLAHNGIEAVTSSTGWVDEVYDHTQYGVTEIADFIPFYEQLKTQASLLSGNLPDATGIYRVLGDYELNNTALTNGFLNTVRSMIIIIEGNLQVEKSYQTVPGSQTVFIIEGNLLINKQVETMSGFFIVTGFFDSDINGGGKKPLTVYGSVIALEGYSLPRDLDDTGHQNNTNSPSERFVWQAGYVSDQILAKLLNNQTNNYQWNEIEKP